MRREFRRLARTLETLEAGFEPALTDRDRRLAYVVGALVGLILAAATILDISLVVA